MSAISTVPHLWEVTHPYQATEGCYYARTEQCHEDYGSFTEFLAAEGEQDVDLNLVYRWDWVIADVEENGLLHDELRIFTIQQRKARPQSYFVRVTADDEAAVLRWLTPRARRLAELWTPIWQGGAA